MKLDILTALQRAVDALEGDESDPVERIEDHLNEVKTMLDQPWEFDADNMRDDPKVIPGTIHSVKGGEADQVYLWPDLSPDGYWQGWAHNPDPTIRQFYVGMTRAREGLTLCQAAGTTAISWKPRTETLRAA